MTLCLLFTRENTFPPDEPLTGNTDEPFPYTIVADEAFPLETWMMGPYPGRALDSVEKKYPIIDCPGQDELLRILLVSVDSSFWHQDYD